MVVILWVHVIGTCIQGINKINERGNIIMTDEAMTTLQTSFTEALTDLQAPVLAIMAAGVTITLIFVAYRALKSAFKKSTN